MAQVQKLGFYSFELANRRASFLQRNLFVSEDSPRLKKELISVARALPSAHKVEWQRSELTDAASTLTAAVTAGATSITVADGTKFRVNQQIALGAFGDVNREVVVITAISGNTLTITAAANAHNAGDPVVAVSYSKGHNQTIDAANDRWTTTPEFNYLQKFAATIAIDLNELSTYDPASIALAEPSLANAFRDGMVSESTLRAAYLKMKVAQALGEDVLGDAEKAFFEGVRQQVGNSYFMGGVATFGVTVNKDWASLTTDEEKFKYIVAELYKAYNIANKLGASAPAIIANSKFVEKFIALQPSNYINEKMPEEDGYRLHRVRILDKVFDLYSSAYLDSLTAADNVGAAYVVPLDTVAMKTRPVQNVRAVGTTLQAQMGRPDIVMVKDITAESQTGDSTVFNIFFEGGLIFAAPADAYRKLVFTNMN